MEREKSRARHDGHPIIFLEREGEEREILNFCPLVGINFGVLWEERVGGRKNE